MTSLKFRATEAATKRPRARQENREDQIRRGVADSEGGGPAVRRLGVPCDSDSVSEGSGRTLEMGPTSDADAATLRQTRSAGDWTA